MPVAAMLQRSRHLVQLGKCNKVGVYATDSSVMAGPHWPVEALFRPMPTKADFLAHDLYHALRLFDAEGVNEIWMEPLPDHPDWEAIHDRVNRAVRGSQPH
jgi:hypothetical protein